MSNLYESLMDRLDGHQYNNYFTCCCPYHKETHPSFFVYEDGTAKCFSCGKFATHVQLDRFLGSHFRPTLDTVSTKILPGWRSWDLKYGGLDGIVRFANQNLQRYPQYKGYYKKRGVDAFIVQGRLGWLDGWATIPVFSRTMECIDLVVRSTRGRKDTRYVVKPVTSADHGSVRPLYCPNWKRVEESETVYVVYGIFDAISMEMCGLPVVTGITGKSLSAELLAPLKKRFIILPDYHEENSAHNLANSLGWRGKVKQLLFPNNTKDVDDVRREYGNSYLLNLLGV